MRIVIVSNRLPFTVSFEEGAPQFRPSSGGLTTGIWSYLQRCASDPSAHPDFLWVGWPGPVFDQEHQPAVRNYGLREFKTVPVFLSQQCVARFYDGFCNKTIWPLFHYFPSLTQYEEEDFQEYKRANKLFADALLPLLRPDDLVWIHDYQLMLVPALLRAQRPDLAIGFFLHIPFPSFEVFRLLPQAWRLELLEGMLGASLIGFHTHDYVRDFLTSVLRTAGYEHQLGMLTLRDRIVKVDTFPMGIDFERFAAAAAAPETQGRAAQLRRQCAGQRIIFSVDRLDYTKGLINRLRGYELFLKRNPQWREKVVFVISVAPSRTGVKSYQVMREELERTVGSIVGRYGNVNWVPLVYQYRNLGFEEIVAMYRACDVALITPLRDGMNLVAKEFIASRQDQGGVLILSEMAGAAKEMGEALVINPFQAEDFSRAIEQGLTMPIAEQVRRNTLLQDRLRRYDVNRWAEEFLQTLVSSQQTQAAKHARSLSGRAQSGLIHHFRRSIRRMLLVDYDGTLVPFVDDPREARPDRELLMLVKELASEPANELVVVSGRTRADLEMWLGGLPLSLIAEHGAWLRPRGESWQMHQPLGADWKARVRPILQLYVDRLPGALLEEKEFSLAWHYRKADPEQGLLRAKELLDDLAGYTRNIDVQVLAGNKVLEVRNSGVGKGTAALQYLSQRKPDFILAVGDDSTDEDLFRALPAQAWSVRVGMADTAARFHVPSHLAVRRLLSDLASCTHSSLSGLYPVGGNECAATLAMEI